jgi:hypothetical protein
LKQKLEHLKENNDANPKDMQRGNIPPKKKLDLDTKS